MKPYLLALLLFLITGCTKTVTIHEVTISDTGTDSLYITVTTDENIDKYTDSYWAYKPFLIYRVNSSEKKHKKQDNLTDNFPFSAKRIDKNTALNKSSWEIKRINSINISGVKYVYNLYKLSNAYITLKIYGATMGGGHLDSESVKISLDAIYE